MNFNKESRIEKLILDINQKMDNLMISARVWLTTQQLSSYLGMKVNTIYQYVSNNKIPFHKIPNSSKLIFKRLEIDNWIMGSESVNIGNKVAGNTAEEIWDKIR